MTSSLNTDDLTVIPRDYASAVSGRDMSAQTLSDLHRGDRDARHRDGLNLSRQTAVRQAAEWVSTLVERWR